jgi:colicin import membrane protein
MPEALAPQFEYFEPSLVPSAALAAAVHLLLLAILVFGVRWQSRPPETVMVELWQPPAPVAEVPRVEPPPAPPPEPPQPKAVQTPEPRLEPPKPEIAVKAPTPPKAVAKPEPKPRPEAKPRPPAPPREDVQKRLREELAREQQALSVERERQSIKEQLQREQASAHAKAQADYIGRIVVKIRGNIVLPPAIRGNPEAIFDVVQLPTGEVLSAKLRKSSGHRGYDEAVERAILKSSPLPKADAGLFSRQLELKFRPLDK